ncbi:heparinase II/III domain-containing protein [Paenibacillus cymbidii]|uniref:heparinase II/III domain-containing protein n=1 Tax=Paenibacillus cymbidii TaxID=1639034 RepID=UPI001080763E|nr:heparinase II/III family protein [Paenibacillus cymbidii]
MEKKKSRASVELFGDCWSVLPKWPHAPVLDGTMGDPLWEDAARLGGLRYVYTLEAASGADFRAAYDAEHVYVGMALEREEAEATAFVDIVVSPQAAGERHGVVTIPLAETGRSMTADWNVGREVAKANPQRETLPATVRLKRTPGAGTTFEAAIPLNAFGREPREGDEWRVNAMLVRRLHTKPMASWVPIRTTSFWDAGGTIAVKANAVDEGRLGSVYFGRLPCGRRWQPEAEMTYLGFTEKAVEIDGVWPDAARLELIWKDPAGRTTSLEPVSLAAEGARTIVFRHPEPLLEGLYELQLVRSGRETFVAKWTFDRMGLIRAGEAAFAALSGGVLQPAMGAAVAEEELFEHDREQPAVSEEVRELLALLPDRAGFLFLGSPEHPDLHPDRLYRLSDDRRRIVSLKTGASFPNDQFPETKSVVVAGRGGEPVVYPYYEDERGRRYFFSAHLWYWQKEYVLRRTELLAAHDPYGAAVLLRRFAEVYERYVPSTDYVWHQSPHSPASGPPFNYWGGVWYRWSCAELFGMLPLLRAFAAVRGTEALRRLSRESGEDVESRFRESVVVPSVRYALSFPLLLGNMNYTQWLGLAAAGRALQEPDLIHLTVEWIRKYLAGQFLSDGYWNEVAPSYHVQSTEGLLEAMEALRGWSDPPGYMSPRTGERFDGLDLLAESQVAGKAAANRAALAYPDGRMLPVQDTWASDRTDDAPCSAAGTLLLPAARIARLAVGEGERMFQLYLGFEPKYGHHNHFDPLHLALFADGRELLPDLGYTYTKARYYTLSTFGHNTVVVDGADMTIDAASVHGGRIRGIAEAGPVRLQCAEQREAYPQTSEYGRELWQIAFDDARGGGYALDLFRICGGFRHEYTLQGDANHNGYWTAEGVSLAPYGDYLLPPGVAVHEAADFRDPGEAEGFYPAYAFMRHVRRADLHGNKLEMMLMAAEEGGGDSDGEACGKGEGEGNGHAGRLRMTALLEQGESELFVGFAPSLRSTRLYGKSRDTNDEAVRYEMPKLVLRRERSEGGLRSAFVSLLEPLADRNAGSRIERVERVRPESAPDGAIVVRVVSGDTDDLLVSVPSGCEQAAIVAGGVTMRGRWGFVRRVAGEVRYMGLVGGTMLRCGASELAGHGFVSGTVAAVKRRCNGDRFDGIVAREPIAPLLAERIAGRYAVLTHPDGTTSGYRVGSVAIAAGQTCLAFAEHDPGFELGDDEASELKFHPGTRWTGDHTFDIALVDEWRSEAGFAGR